MALEPQSVFQETRALQRGAMSITPLGSVTLAANAQTPFSSLQLSGILGRIVDAQSIWCDASAAPSVVTILNQKTRQYVRFPAGSAGWQPMLIGTDATALTLYCAEAATIGLAVCSLPLVSALQDLGTIQSPNTSRRVDFPASTSDAEVLAANAQREGFTVYNQSTFNLYLLMEDGTASATNFTVLIPPGAYFESPFSYGGQVKGIWDGATGGARVTEFF